MKKIKYLYKYNLKFHSGKEVIFTIMFCIFSFSFFYSSFLSDLSKSNKEYTQYADCKVYRMNVKGELGDESEVIEKKVKWLQETMLNDSTIDSVGYFPREIDESKIMIEGALLYCPAKNYQFDMKNLKQKRGFSEAENEIVKVSGKHEIGEEIQGVVNQQETTFKIVDEVSNHCILDFVSNDIINVDDLKYDVYILNPSFYAQEQFYKCSSSGVFYLKTDSLEIGEYLLENGEFLETHNATIFDNICYDYGYYLQAGLLIIEIMIYIVLSCLLLKKKSLLYWNLLMLSKSKKMIYFGLRDVFGWLIGLIIGIFFAATCISCSNRKILVNILIWLVIYIIMQIILLIKIFDNEENKKIKEKYQSIVVEPCVYRNINVEEFYLLRIMPFVNNGNNIENEVYNFLEELNFLKYRYDKMKQFPKMQRLKAECYFLYLYIHTDNFTEILGNICNDKMEQDEINNFLERMSNIRKEKYESFSNYKFEQDVWEKTSTK